MFETDSKQVPWGKDEKDFEKRVKSAWTRWKESGWNKLCIVRLSCAMEMLRCNNANAAAGSDLDVCDASCLVCHHLCECGDNSGYMVVRLRLIECSLQYSLSDRKCFVRLCWLAPCTTVHELSTVCWNGSPSWHAKLWLNCSLRPVLKHGPRSLTHMQVSGWWSLCA